MQTEFSGPSSQLSRQLACVINRALSHHPAPDSAGTANIEARTSIAVLLDLLHRYKQPSVCCLSLGESLTSENIAHRPSHSLTKATTKDAFSASLASEFSRLADPESTENVPRLPGDSIELWVECYSDAKSLPPHRQKRWHDLIQLI
ncbi:unnamed protein product [Protopolystoma xenopodis]|uniref:Uncharacterized protein n=1 Tax=Protopolystoma xenopodis TaxID=117903 RepID=A0A3S5AVB5_9PLAT|nr:unnamed protein product [Protopolystoma xenopodis]